MAKSYDEIRQNYIGNPKRGEEVRNTSSSYDAIRSRFVSDKPLMKTDERIKQDEAINQKLSEDRAERQKKYEEYINSDGYKAYQSMLDFDLENGKNELDSLSSVADSYKAINQYMNRLEDGSDEWNSYNNKLSELNEKTGYASYDELVRGIAEKTAYYNQAKMLQDTKRYEDEAMNAPDFAQYSEIGANLKNPTQKEAEGLFSIGDVRVGGKDVNNIVTYSRDEDNIAGIFAGSNVGDYKYTYMNKDEVSVYNYYLAKEREGLIENGTAKAYLNGLTDTLNQRQANEWYEEVYKDDAIAELLFGINAGLDQFGSGMKSLVNSFVGKDDYIAPTPNQYISGMVREDLADDGFKIGGVSLGQIAYDTITTSSNMIPSIITSAIVNAVVPGSGALVGSAMMGSSAAGNAYQEMINNGYSADQARTFAYITGSLEGGLEYILGGISALGGKLTGHAIEKLTSGISNGVIKFIAHSGGEMASEGIEEAIQEILSPYVKALATGENPDDIDLAEVVYSGLLGALSAGVMNGTTDITNRTIENINAKETYGGNEAYLVAEGLASEQYTKAYELAQKNQKRLDSGKELSGNQIRKQVNANNEAIASEEFNEIKDVATNRLDELGEVFTSEKVADAIAKKITGQEISESENALIENGKYSRQVLAELTEADSNNQRKIDTLMENADSVNSVVTKDGKNLYISGVDSIDNGKIVLKASDGTTIKGDDVTFNNDGAERVFNRIEALGLDTSVSNYILNSLKQSTVPANIFANEVGLAFAYGRTNQRRRLSSLSINQDLATRIFDEGRKASESNANVMTEDAKTRIVKDKTSGVRMSADLKARFKRGKLNQKQNATIHAATFLAKTSSMDIIVYEGYKRGNKSYYMIDGVEYEGSPNGWFESGTNQIYVDINAGNDYSGIGLFTLGHESGHYLRDSNASEWQKMADIIVEEIDRQAEEDSNKSTFEEMYAQKLSDYEKRREAGQEGYKGKSDAKLSDMAYEDVICDSLSSIMTDKKTFEEFSRQLETKSPTLWQRFKAFIENFLKKLDNWLNSYKDVATESESGEAIRNAAEEFRNTLREMYVSAFLGANENFNSAVENSVSEAEVNENIEEVGLEYDKDTESVAPSVVNSERTWNESDYVKERDKAALDMSKVLGISVAKAKAYIDNVNSIAKMIANDRVRLDYIESEGVSSFVSNTEYGGSIDFSTICKKRRLLTGTFSAIQNALPNTVLTAEDVLNIRKMMKDRGYEVSCGLCYVEGSRAKMGEYAKEFLDEYAKTNPEYMPTLAEVNTPDGIEKIRMEHPEVYKEYETFMNKLAQRKPKLYQMATAYNGEILNKFKKADNVSEKNKNGGLRLQSFSDFEIIHLIDCMQVIMDMSRVGLAGQAYTKVPDFAYALGGTGLKINLSLIAKGVDKNGKLVLDETEGMKKADAEKLRNMYSDNVGTIIVVFNDEQLKAALADEFIDYIIPFHRSQWNSKQYEMMGLPADAKDYTMVQNESYIEPVYNKNGKKERPSNYMPNTYWDFTKSGKENAEAYLQMCALNNRKPKFSHLLVDNKDGSYSLQPDGSTDGYWKLLIDFKMYNNDGVGVPQNAVTPSFNMEEAERMLNEYEGGHQKFPVAQDVVDDFLREKNNEPNNLYSLRAVEPIKPSSNKWEPGVTTAQAMEIYPNLWNVSADESETRNPTQVTITVKTYRKIYEMLKSEGFDGTILDASSGLGFGTKAGVDEYGFDVDDIEPYPSDDYKPKYTDYSKLNKKYDAIISNAVLNVLPQDQRDALVVKMGEMLKDGGRLFINVRSLGEIKGLQKKIDSKTGLLKNITISDSEVAETSKGSYQKGFTKEELKAYIEDALGKDFSVEISNKFGDTSVIVTKKAESRYSNRDAEVDNWLDSLSIDDLIEALDISINSAESKKTERRVDEVNKMLKKIGLEFNGTKTLAWTDERVEKYLDSYASSNPNYAQAYVTYMSPKDFLALTTGSRTYTVDRIVSESEEYGDLDMDKIASSVPMFLDIDEGTKNVRVVGHEGRHRMYLLGKAGVESVPVLLFNYNNKYSKETRENFTLVPQKFFSGELISKGRNVKVEKAIPLSRSHKDEVIREFGSGNQNADVRYSDRVLMGSMFSGGGTLEAGLVYQMVDKEFAVEYNKQIASVYTDNHGKEHMFVGDVRDFDSKSKNDVFYLHASPVCKNFSNASHKGGETTLDITTAEATARVLEEQMPQVFTVENVKRYIDSEAYNIITNKLNELGYTWDVDVYKASDYGNPTKRERMVIRAVKDGVLPPKPQKVAEKTSWYEATKDLFETELKPSTLVKSKIEGIKNTPGITISQIMKSDKPIMIYDTTKSKQVTYAWGDELAPTLTTKCGDARIIWNGRVYAPTPKFMGRLQGLPDNYKYPKAATNAFKIIGNGIPTQLTKAVMGGVLDSAYEQTHDGQVLYSERDNTYMSLAENPSKNREALDKMVEEAAREAGFNSPKLYHGTNQFGFTKIDTSVSDDKISFFATDSENTAQSYSYGAKRRSINPKSDGATVDYEEEFKNVSDKFNDAVISAIDAINRVAGIYNFLDRGEAQAKIEDLLSASQTADGWSDTIEDLVVFDWLYDAYDNAGLDIDEHEAEMDAFFDDYVAPLISIGNAKNEAAKAWNEGDTTNGLYELYANTDNMLTIDAQGRNWNNIRIYEFGGKFNEWYKKKYKGYSGDMILSTNTREIAGYASYYGYSGVIIENVRDDGGRGTEAVKPATVYIFFDPKEQVKSADTVTYDDNGDIIPLSERFNKDNDDIRYSNRETFAKYVKGLPSITVPEASEYAILSSEVEKNNYNKNRAKRVVDFAYSANYIYFYHTLSKQNNTFKVLFRVNIENTLAEVERTMLNHGVIRDQKGYDDLLAEIRSKYGADIYDSKFSPDRRRVERVNSLLAKDFLGDILDEYSRSGRNDSSKSSANYKTYIIGGMVLSDRNSALDPRTILSNALASTVQNDIEKKYIEDYQANIGEINEAQTRLESVKAEIKEISFAKGTRDMEKLKSLKEEATKLKNRINVYDKKLLKLEATKPLQNVIEREKAKAIARTKAEAKETLKEFKEQALENQIALKEHYKELKEKAKVRSEKTNIRHKIKKLIAELQSADFNPKANKYIPKNLMKPVNEILSLINLDTGRSENLSAKLAELKVKYDALANDERYSVVYDKNVSDMVQALTQIIGDTPLNKMNRVQLEATYNTLKALTHTIKNAIKIRINGIEADAYELSSEMRVETNEASGIGSGVPSRWLLTSLRPETAFDLFGGFKKNSTWNQVYQMLNQGQMNKMRVEMEANAIFKDVFADEDYVKSLSDTKNLVDIGLTDDDGNTVKVTKGMALAIYKALMNEDNARHIMVGGITVPNLQKYYKGSDDAYGIGHIVCHGIGSKGLADNTYELRNAKERKADAVAEGNELLVAEIDAEINELNAERRRIIEEGEAFIESMRRNIGNILTDKDIALLNASNKFFDEFSKNELNKTTMELYGFEKAQVENYLPIHTDPNFRQASFEQITKDMNLENSGFMKDRVKATNPIMLEDLAEIINSQISKVSTYVGLTIPVKNFGKIYGKTDSGFTSSLQDAIASKFGKPGQKYIDNLLSDIVGSRRGETTFLDRARGYMAGATLSVNPRVALAQAASYPTAASEVGWKALAKASGKFLKSHDLELIAKYTPLLYNRSKGANIEASDIKEMSKVQNRVMRKLNWLMGWIEAIDKRTVGTLWYASQYYVQDNFKNYEVGTDEYYMKVAEVFNNVVERTQPNYTVLQRPDILRNPNAVVKQLTMFMTQRLQNFNIVYDSVARLNKYAKDQKRGVNNVTKEDVSEARKGVVNAVGSQLVASAVIVGMKFIVDAIMHNMNGYRDDDKELTGESIGEAITENMLDTIIGNLLGGSELFAVLNSVVNKERYYGISINGVDAYSDAIEDFVKLAQKPDLDKCNELAKSICTFLGIPLNNVEKLGKGIYYQIEDISNGEFLSFEAGVERSKKQTYGRLYRALVSKDTKELEKLKAFYGDDAKFNSAVWNSLKANDTRIKAAAEARLNGDLDEYMRIARQIKSEGAFTQDQIVSAINSMMNTLSPKEASTTVSDTHKGFLTSSDIDVAIDSYNLGAINAIEDEMEATYMSNGKTEEEAEDAVDRAIKTAIKDAFFGSAIGENDAINILTTNAGMSLEDANNRVRYWNFEKAHPEMDIDESVVNKYYSTVEPSGVNVDVFYDFYTRQKGLKQEDILPIIDSLPITSAQKDALWFFKGWAESTLNTKAPWR